MSSDDPVQRDASPRGVGRPPGADGRDLTAEVNRLHYRVLRLERALISLCCLGAAALLVLGTFLPMFTETTAEDADEPFSVATIAGAGLSNSGAEVLLGEDSGSSDSPALLIAFLVGFIGLAIIVAMLVLVVLPIVAAGLMTGGRRRFSRIVAVLGLVGSLVPVLLSLIAVGPDESDAGWGGAVLLAGMIASLVLVFASGREEAERLSSW